MEYKIQELAKLAHISKRTLHYYDEIGLLHPSHVSSNGYRYYGQKELLLLQQILFFKELGFPLDQVQEIITMEGFSLLLVLEDQKKLLKAKAQHVEKLLKTIDTTIHLVKG